MYIGPETLMPLASILAAIAGFLMLFWRRTVSVAKAIGRGFGRLFGRSSSQT